MSANEKKSKPDAPLTDFYARVLPLKSAAPMAPRHERGRPKAGHKYKVGQTLFFTPSIFEHAARKGAYRVVSLLPSDGDDHQYRLKSDTDGHERVVRESQLTV